MSGTPDMLTHMGGVPVGGARFTSPWATHWFVDATDGNDNNTGKAPNRAKATIQAAVTASSGGDVIYIRPQTYKLGTGFNRYQEDITIAQGGAGGTGVVDTNANKTIIGVTQRQYPSDMLGVRTKYATAAHGGWLIQASGTHIEGIAHFGESATTTAMYFEGNQTTRVTGIDGCSMYNCAIKGKEVKIGSLLGGGADLSIISCRFQCAWDGSGTPLLNIYANGGNIQRLSVVGCDFVGGNANNYSTSPITIGPPTQSLLIKNCHFSQVPDTGPYIDFSGAASNSGTIANCFFGSEGLAATETDWGGGDFGVHAAGVFDENGAVDMS